LDIAEVDLIVLFEAVASPISLVQRCGRTGRKRSGRVVMLVSDEIEKKKLEKSNDDAWKINKTLQVANTKDNVNKNNNNVDDNDDYNYYNKKNSIFKFFENNPRMIPINLKISSSDRGVKFQHMAVSEFQKQKIAGSNFCNSSNTNNNSNSSNEKTKKNENICMNVENNYVDEVIFICCFFYSFCLFIN
jgi:superfamily II DNA/RNA helicase